jgi:ABC-type glutathione transport system ATPase component
MKHETLLSVRNLSVKQKGGPILVENSSFAIGYNQCIGIIGESGSGKSMTCKAVMGLLPASAFAISGAVLYKGMDMLGLREASRNKIRGRKIAFIPQNPMTAFNPVFKIGNQVMETLRAHISVSRREAYDLAITHLKKMNLPRTEELMNSYPHMLSGGMLQRVMIAIALMMSPDLIIADEPTTALDISTQAIVLEEFKGIRATGISMLVVSHNFGVIAQLADRIIVMKAGEIMEQDTTRNLLMNPGQAYTRELIDASILRKIG